MLYRGHYEGGCFCGRIRYAFEDVFDAGYCHCSICRRSSGAPVMAWANTPRARFRVVAGQPRHVRSSTEFQRAFCADCGTVMWTESVDRARWDQVSVHHGTIDRCAQIEPAIHICDADRLPWLHIDDALPRSETNRIPHPSRRGDARWDGGG